MNAIKQFWQDFKSEPDIWFFYAFLLSFPLSVRKVIALYPIQGRFNEYFGIYLYLSDIFLILALFSWIFILCHNFRFLSIFKSASLQRIKLWIKSFPQVTPKHFLAYLGLILVLWSFLSLGWSESKSLSLFRSIKLFEFYLLAIFVAYRIVPRLPETKMFHVEHFWAGGTILRDTLKLVIFGGVINSVLAIWQFITQHSIGLTFLKESVIAPNMPGVAKIIFRSCPLGECSTPSQLFHVEQLTGQAWNIPSGVEHYIRAYGLLPHPNILGGFLLLSIILTIYYHKLFQTESNVPRGTFDSTGAGQNNQNCHSGLDPESSLESRALFSGSRIKSGMTLILIFTQIIALILTFSKSAIIGLGVALIYIYVTRLPREPKLFHVEQFSGHWGGTFSSHPGWNIQNMARLLAKTALFTFFAISVLISVFPGLSPIQNQSLEERQMLINVSRLPETKMFHVEHFWAGGTFINFLIGIGQGQSVWSMRNLALEDWQYQPVHNVFLLIWSELGMVGLVLFIFILWKMFHLKYNVPSQAQCSTWNIVRDRRGTFGSYTRWNTEFTLQIVIHGILLGFTFIMLFDHYLWDIQQGQIMLWIVIGLLLGTSLTGSNKSDSISL